MKRSRPLTNVTIEEKKLRNNEVERIAMKCDNVIPDVAPPLPNRSFFMLIVGGPGSGKTNLLLNLITKHGMFYNKKFHRVYLWSPSLHTAPQIDLPRSQKFSMLNTDELGVIEELQKERDENVLFIFDDMINFIEKGMQQFLTLCYNRRHLSKQGKGCACIIMTTQKYNKCPKELRTVASHVIMFNSKNRKEMMDFYEELIPTSRPAFMKVCKHIFDKPHQFLYLDLTKPSDEMFHHNFNPLCVKEMEEDEIV